MARTDRKKIGTTAFVLGIALGSCCAAIAVGQNGGEPATTAGMVSARGTRSALRPLEPGIGQVTQKTTSQNADSLPLPAEAAGEPPRYGLPTGKIGQFENQPVDSPLPVIQGFQSEFPFFDFSHGDANDPGRHVGLGVPLEGTSWLNRPWYLGWFVGGLNGGALVDQHVEQHLGLFGGYRLGYDFDHYWGTEGRMGFANLPTTDSVHAISNRTSNDRFFDANLLYYPWGDAKWRPFLSAGLGWGDFRFVDDHRNSFSQAAFEIPLGFGVKYYYRKWLALRIDAMDNIAFSSAHTDNMHNVSMTFGVEVRMGGRRRGYFPWNPGNSPW